MRGALSTQRRQRSVALTGTVALTATLLTALGPTSPVAAATACAPVQFLGARGSGEPLTKRDHLFGPEVNTVYTALAGQLAGSVSWDFVNYTAADVKVLKPTRKELAQYARVGPVPAAQLYAANHLTPFQTSIAEGVTLAAAQVLAMHATCPTSRIVLSGYSQGAMVMHRVLLSLADEARTDVLAQISGVVLIADGDKVRDTAANHFGSADFTIAQGVQTALSLGARDIPSSVASSTYDLCNARDIVCDFNSNLLAYARGGVLASAVNVHTSYARSRLLRNVGTSLGRELLTSLTGQPLALTTGTLPDAVVGTPYSTTLTAAGGVAPYHWLATSGVLPPLPPQPALPDGLTLNATTGEISGTPTAAGSGAVVITVTDAANVAVAGTFTWAATAATGGQPVVHHGTGPAGIVTAVSLISCPAVATAGNQMWINTAEPFGLNGAFSLPSTGIPNADAWIYSSGSTQFTPGRPSVRPELAPGTYHVHIDCVETPPGANPTRLGDYTPVLSYVVDQTITGPGLGLTVDPAVMVPGQPVTVTPNASCPADPAGGSVYVTVGSSTSAQTFVPFGPDGTWSGATLTQPLNTDPAVFGLDAQAICQYPDGSEYKYLPVGQ
jgi:hypothetical protein